MSWIALGLLSSIYLGIALVIWIMYLSIRSITTQLGRMILTTNQTTQTTIYYLAARIRQISALVGYPAAELAKITNMATSAAIKLMLEFTNSFREYLRQIAIVLSAALSLLFLLTILSIAINHPAPLIFIVIPTLVLIFFIMIGYDPLYRAISGEKQRVGRPIAVTLLYVGILAMTLLHGQELFYGGIIIFSVFTLVIMVRGYKSYYFGTIDNSQGRSLEIIFTILLISLIIKFASPELHTEIMKLPGTGAKWLTQKIKQRNLDILPGYTIKEIKVYQLQYVDTTKKFIRIQTLSKGTKIWLPDYFKDRETLKGKKLTLVRVITDLGDKNLYIPLDAIRTGFPPQSLSKSPDQNHIPQKPKSESYNKIPPRPKNLRGERFFYLPPGKIVSTVFMSKNDVVKIYTTKPYSYEVIEAKTGPLLVVSTEFQYPPNPPLIKSGDLRLRGDGVWVGIEFVNNTPTKLKKSYILGRDEIPPITLEPGKVVLTNIWIPSGAHVRVKMIKSGEGYYYCRSRDYPINDGWVKINEPSIPWDFVGPGEIKLKGGDKKVTIYFSVINTSKKY